MKKLNLILLSLAVFALASCIKEDLPPKGTVTGFAPVYIEKSEAFTTGVGNPRVISYPGKMYLLGSFVFLTDIGNGVHIIDNSDPTKPKKIRFISIPGVNDVAVKSSVLYADNLMDLVAFDISDFNNITMVKRIKDVYPLENQMYPDFATGYFECADTSKGYIIRWELRELDKPKCFR